MIPVACLTLVVLGVLVALVAQQRSHQEAQAQWAVERRELLNRIQRPEHIPLPAPAHYEIPEQPPDEWALVGTIQTPPESEE